MAWNDLKAAVAAVVRTNGTQDITGALLQSTLNSIIDQVGADSTFRGIATPSTIPGTPDGPVFYLATQTGVYANFGGHTLLNPGFLKWGGSSWSFISLGVFSKEDEIFALDTMSGHSVTESGRLDLSGIKRASPVNYVSDYVKIKSRDLIVYGYSSDITALLSFYDINKQFISCLYGADKNEVFTVVKNGNTPTGSYYVRFTGKLNGSFLIADSVKDLRNDFLDTAITNISQAFPLESGYYTLGTARTVLPIQERKAGHVITFADGFQSWKTYKYRGIQNKNDKPGGWNSDTMWELIPTGSDLLLIQNDLDTLDNRIELLEEAVTSDSFQDKSGETLIDTYVINAITGNYVISGTTQAATPSYIPCKGAKKIVLTVPTGTSGSSLNGIAFYDKNDAFIKGHIRPLSDVIERVVKTYEVPEGATSFRTTFFNTANRAIHGDFFCYVYYGDSLEELGNDEICAYFSVSSTTGELNTSTNWGVTRYINCRGLKRIILKMPIWPTPTTDGIAFYDASKSYISGVSITEGVEGYKWINVEVPDSASFFRTTYWDFENSKIYGDFEMILMYENGFLKSGKRPYKSDLIFFSQKVNQTVNNNWSEDNSIVTPESYKDTTGVLILPPNYDPQGPPVPIIMYCHGYSHYVYYGTWGSTSNFLLQKQRWANRGFAVFDCNGARNNNKVAQFTGAGSMQFVTAYKKCFDYIKKHYNVEDKACVVGGSAGGPTAINFCYNHSNLVYKLALLSPWTDLYLCSWGQNVRNTFVEYLGFTDTSNYEPSKALGYDPAKRIINVGGQNIIFAFPVPVKGWVGSLEVGSVWYDPLLNYFDYLRAGGNLAMLRKVTGLTHNEVVSGNNGVIDTEVASWFNL